MNDARTIDRVVQSEIFQTLYNGVSEAEREIVISIIADGRKVALNNWVDVQRGIHYAEQSVRNLRIIAQRLGVAYYNQLSKATLLSEIAKCHAKISSES